MCISVMERGCGEWVCESSWQGSSSGGGEESSDQCGGPYREVDSSPTVGTWSLYLSLLTVPVCG